MKYDAEEAQNEENHRDNFLSQIANEWKIFLVYDRVRNSQFLRKGLMRTIAMVC